LHTDATVSCWGRNTYGQLGDGTRETRPTASPVPGLTGVVELSGGTDYTCARLGDGSLYCWGYNGFSNAGGNLGDGTIAARDVPTRVLGPADHAQVDAGRSTCSLRTDGSVWCWGANIAGSLGDGTSVSRVVPTLVWAL
jgi:alpha-tubulin suppressor-like RCC1 family protein